MQPDGIWHDAQRDPPAENPGETAVLWTFSDPGDSGHADLGCLPVLREIDWPREKWKLAGVWTVKGEGRPRPVRFQLPRPGEQVEFE